MWSQAAHPEETSEEVAGGRHQRVHDVCFYLWSKRDAPGAAQVVKELDFQRTLLIFRDLSESGLAIGSSNHGQVGLSNGSLQQFPTTSTCRIELDII